MAAFAIPLLEAAVAALGGWLLRAAAVLAGAGVAQVAGRAKDDEQARSATQELVADDRPCKDCPPREGFRKRSNGGMPKAARRYQAHVTGWPCGFDPDWSDEWSWNAKMFDAFVSEPCLIQEAKGNYDQFLTMEWAQRSFKGFRKMREEIKGRGLIAKAHPPTRVRYYFQGPLTLDAMRKTLLKSGVEFVLYP